MVDYEALYKTYEDIKNSTRHLSKLPKAFANAAKQYANWDLKLVKMLKYEKGAAAFAGMIGTVESYIYFVPVSVSLMVLSPDVREMFRNNPIGSLAIVTVGLASLFGTIRGVRSLYEINKKEIEKLRSLK